MRIKIPGKFFLLNIGSAIPRRRDAEAMGGRGGGRCESLRVGRVNHRPMQVGLLVAVMTVKEGRSPGPLGSGVEEDPAPPAGPNEDRSPAPAPMDSSHR